MEAQKLETEFLLYWSKLTDVQKESVFYVVRNFAVANEGGAETVILPEEQMQRIRNERDEHHKGSKSFSWEEVKEMARNKNKRHGLSS